jgi:rhodanese-related sulfurtransferase
MGARLATAVSTILTVAVAAVASAPGCGYDGPMLTVEELKARLDDPSRAITVIDVRPASDFSKGHVNGAINIPLTQLQRKTDAINALDGEIAVICNCGKGALAAAKQLQSNGIPAALVEGGYKKWKAAGYPLTRGAK